MKSAVAALAVLALIAPDALAESSRTPTQTPSQTPAPQTPSLGGWLRLPYGNTYVALPSDGLGTLRFESAVDVYAHVKRDPNEALALILREVLPQPPIYRGAVGPPKPANTVNLVPLFEWFAKKIKDGRQNTNPD